MGNRLSKLVTRTGDTGTTGLGDGSRLRKDAARVEAIGTVDELNSSLGLVAATPGLPADIAQCVLRLQHDLFDLGGELAIPGHAIVTEAHIAQVEADVELFNERLPPLKEFILPGGGMAAAHCHLSRTIARRAERRVWTLADSEAVSENVCVYLNRLSDLLFVLARLLARHEHGSEVLWDRKRLAE